MLQIGMKGRLERTVTKDLSAKVWGSGAVEGYGCNVRIPRGDEEAAAQRALGFPEGFMIPCLIGIGRPAETAVRTKQIPVDYDAQIHWQRF